jgi:hypothetical protein
MFVTDLPNTNKTTIKRNGKISVRFGDDVVLKVDQNIKNVKLRPKER